MSSYDAYPHFLMPEGLPACLRSTPRVRVAQIVMDHLAHGWSVEEMCRRHAMAEQWQRESRPFSGLVFGHQLRGTVGQYVRDLELIAKASEQTAWRGVVAHLPF